MAEDDMYFDDPNDYGVEEDDDGDGGSGSYTPNRGGAPSSAAAAAPPGTVVSSAATTTPVRPHGSPGAAFMPRLASDTFVSNQPAQARERVFSPDDVISQLIDPTVTQVSQVLNWSRSSTLALLRHYKWKRETLTENYFADPDQVIRKTKIRNSTEDVNWTTAENECLMCFDDVPAKQAAHLSCGHVFCTDCWNGHLRYALDNNAANSVSTRCPMKGCPVVCGELTFQTMLSLRPADAKYLSKYRSFLVSSFVSDSECCAYCPAPGCTFIIYYPGVSRRALCQPVSCRCGKRFCFLCNGPDHAPASCTNWKQWLLKEQSESETANWVMANTKLCAGCGKATEKNGGCNHMTCSQCKYEWCWVCEGEWSKHGSSYYKCNFFDSTKEDKSKTSARDSARTELERYLFYYSRYRNHEQSQKLDGVVMAKVRRHIREEVARCNGRTMVDVDFIERTASVLIECRHMLMYSYVYAFYLTDMRAKALFEYNQSQLEYFTEMLSGYVEKPAALDRQEVVNRTAIADSMLTKLKEGCLQF